MLTSKKPVIPDGDPKNRAPRFRKPHSMSTGGAKRRDGSTAEEGINLDDLKRSMEEVGLGDVSIGEETFSSVLKTLEAKPTGSGPFDQIEGLHSDPMADHLSVDTTMLLDEYSLPKQPLPPPHHSLPPPPPHHSLQQQAMSEFVADPGASIQSEKQRFQDYLGKQLEILTGIRRELLRDEHDDLDVGKLSKFQFWKKVLLKERQACAEQVAELKLEIRELRTILDDIQDQIYLLPAEPSDTLRKMNSALEEYPQIRRQLKK